MFWEERETNCGLGSTQQKTRSINRAFAVGSHKLVASSAAAEMLQDSANFDRAGLICLLQGMSGYIYNGKILDNRSANFM